MTLQKNQVKIKLKILKRQRLQISWLQRLQTGTTIQRKTNTTCELNWP